MGFFSQDCERCGHPILSDYVTDPSTINHWMTQAVVIFPSRSGNDYPDYVSGTYDGYGTVLNSDCCGDDHEAVIGFVSTVYHKACYEVLFGELTFEEGNPNIKYKGPSRDSSDQGYFFDETTHMLLDPRIDPNEGAIYIDASYGVVETAPADTSNYPSEDEPF